MSDVLLVHMVSPLATAPTRGYEGDAGLDLACVESVWLAPGAWADIDLGVEVALPRGYWGLLTGRSSTLRRRGLLVNQGIIDNGYRGPLFANVVNMTEHEVLIQTGERLVQFVLLPVWAGAVGVTNQPLPGVTARGAMGFGSTGA